MILCMTSQMQTTNTTLLAMAPPGVTLDELLVQRSDFLIFSPRHLHDCRGKANLYSYFFHCQHFVPMKKTTFVKTYFIKYNKRFIRRNEIGFSIGKNLPYQRTLLL